jgi:peptidoglycan/LPS O-acetylase OafA/YrhL
VTGQRAGTSAPGRIVELDGIRGMAVTLVILYHYFSAVPQETSAGVLTYFQACFRIGWSGVDLFFVLSGFLIGGILLDAKGSPRYFRTFYIRRFHRILPIYYLWIGIYFLMAFTSFQHLPTPLKIVPLQWTLVPIFILFVQNLVTKQLPGFSSRWFGPLWSLAVEEQFYLLMPCLVRFLSRRWLVALLCLTILCAPVARVAAYYWSPTHTAQAVATPCRADALAMGVLLALAWRDELWRGRIHNHRKLFWTLLLGLLIGVLYFAIWNSSQYALMTSALGYSCLDAFFTGILLLALIVPGGYWAAFCQWPIWGNIGRVSYCMYVIHLAVNAFCHAFFLSSAEKISTPSSFAVTLLAAGVTWAVAKISWRYFESPLVRRGHAYRY